MDTDPQQSPFEAALQKYGNPIRVFAESAILRLIGELTGDAEKRFRELNAACYSGDLDGIDDLTTYASMTISQVEGLRKHWHEVKSKNPNLKPTDFSRDFACDFFYPNLDVPEPNSDGPADQTTSGTNPAVAGD